MRIVIAAGGTGGHIYPGIAIAQEIRQRFPAADILFIGGEEGMERDLIAREGYKIQLIKARALLRKISYKAISAPFVCGAGFFQSLGILKNFQPQALVATGGYVSLPVVLAAGLLSIPVYLHEQNVLPGFANRFMSRWAKTVFLSFPESTRYLKGVVTGNPVRKEIREAGRDEARRKLGFAPEDKVVLVLGGSQGARAINQTVVSALPLIARCKIVHVVGQRDARIIDSRSYDFYRRVDYLYNIADTIAAADLAVSRAGATAIAEFLVKEVPMVLVPFPFSAERHQDLNAKVIAEGGAAIVLNNHDLTPEKLAEVIMGDKLDLAQMRKNCRKLAQPDAAKDIVNAVI